MRKILGFLVCLAAAVPVWAASPRYGYAVLDNISVLTEYVGLVDLQGHSIAVIPTVPMQKGGSEVIESMAASADGRFVYALESEYGPAYNGYHGSVIRVICNMAHRVLRTFAFDPSFTLSGLAVSPDGRYLYAGNDVAGKNLHELLVISTATGEITRTVEGLGSTSACCYQFQNLPSPDGRFLYTSANSYNASLIEKVDLGAGAVVNSTFIGADLVRSLALTPDGKSLYHLEDLGFSLINADNFLVENQFTTGFDNAVMKITPDGKGLWIVGTLPSPGAGSPLKMFSTDTHVELGAPTTLAVKIPGSIAFAPDGSLAYVCGWQSNLVIVSAKTGEAVGTIEDPDGYDILNLLIPPK